MPFFYSWILSRIPHIFSCHFFLGSSWLWQFLRLLLILIIFIIMSTRQVFVECLSTEICLVFFSLLNWGYGCGEGRSQDKVPFHHIISQLHAINVIYDHWCWPWHGASYLLFNVVLSKGQLKILTINIKDIVHLYIVQCQF